MVVEEKTPNLKLQCHINTYLMEDLMKRVIQGEELAKLNIFRIFLHTNCLSDLATGGGKSTPPYVLARKTKPHGISIQMASKNEAPPKSL